MRECASVNTIQQKCYGLRKITYRFDGGNDVLQVSVECLLQALILGVDDGGQVISQIAQLAAELVPDIRPGLCCDV